MGFDPRDHAQRLREALKAQQRPDTAETLDPATHPWQQPNVDDIGYPAVPYRNPDLKRYEIYYNSSLAATTGWIPTPVDRRPEVWVVSNRNVANTKLQIYQSDSQEGAPIEIGPGGWAMFPAVGEGRLYVYNAGSAAATVNVWAMSDWWMIMRFQIYPA